MFVPRSSLMVVAIGVALSSAPSAIAGPIAAGAVSGGPPIVGSLEQDRLVARANVITSQYSGVGLDASIFSNLALSALGSIDGTTAFLPTAATGKGFALDYGSFVGFQLVDPLTKAPTTTNHLTVEFIGPRARFGFLYAMSADGGTLGSTSAIDGIGPHGGFLATLDYEGIGMFAAWSLPNSDLKIQLSADPSWGLALIDFSGEVAPPVDTERTPEPATLVLAGCGLLGAWGAAWKRRQRARS